MPKLNQIKIKIFLLIFIVAQLFLSYVSLAYAAADTSQPVYSGVQDQISTFLCTPTPPPAPENQGTVGIISSTNTAAANNPAGADLYNCINKIYRFAIAFGSAIGIGFIVVAGYVYMGAEGNQESVDKAKSIFTSTITSMVILFAGYVLLRAINPDLLQFHNIQPATVIAPSGGIAGPTGGGGGTPGAPTGNSAQLASQILSLNSNGQVNLATAHSSGVPDNATALKNIQDTAAGNPASRSSYEGAPGGTIAINANLLGALVAIGSKYNISVSEIAGGSHSAENTTGGSAGHYGGNAFDINFVNGQHLAPGNQYIQPLMALCTSLGAKQVIDESAGGANHVHCGNFSHIAATAQPLAPSPAPAPAPVVPTPPSQPRGGNLVELSSIIKPWDQTNDPYPALDWGDADATIDPAVKQNLIQLKTSFDSLNQSWQQLGHSPLQVRQVYRPEAYQEHLRSVWEIYAILNNKDYTTGYGCDTVTHDSPDDVNKLTAAQIQILQAPNGEFAKHGVTGPTPPACISDHKSGIAMDITPPVGNLYNQLITQAQNFGLCHNIAGDTPHFALKSQLPAGTNCSQP